MPQRSI